MLVKKSKLSNTQDKVCNPRALHSIFFILCMQKNSLHVYLQLCNKEINYYTNIHTYKYTPGPYTHKEVFAQDQATVPVHLCCLMFTTILPSYILVATRSTHTPNVHLGGSTAVLNKFAQ